MLGKSGEIAVLLISVGLAASTAHAWSTGPTIQAGAAGFGTLGTKMKAEDDVATTTVYPTSVTLPDGSTATTYALPNGSVMESISPPAGFDPLTAEEEVLTRYGFPLRPANPDDSSSWSEAMKAFRSVDVPTEPIVVALRRPSSGETFATLYTNWGGYIAGTLNVQSRVYVAIKGNLRVPTNNGTCSSSNSVGFWIGLGGTGGTYAPNNLVQQGIACGNSYVGSGSSYRPFYEFANTDFPHALCGTTRTLAAGDVIYQNMSFQTSQNKAFFYMEDQTSGIAWSCSYSPPTGWHWDLNTAEWIGEASGDFAVDFGSVAFSNARTQLYSNSDWVTLGSQPITKTIDGDGFVGGRLYQCIVPGAISSGTSFVDDWYDDQCFYVSP